MSGSNLDKVLIPKALCDRTISLCLQKIKGAVVKYLTVLAGIVEKNGLRAKPALVA
jgi:hypothetical protein